MLSLPNFDSWRLDNPYNNEPDEDDPDPALDLGGVVLDRKCVDGEWRYLITGEDGGEPDWLREEEAVEWVGVGL